MNREQIREMLELQEKLEIRIDGVNWREKGHNYPLCIYMEVAEIIDCVGWKHWKQYNEEIDFDKLAGEVVDLWHFCLAHFLMAEPDLDVCAEDLTESLTESAETVKTFEYDDLRYAIISMAAGLSIGVCNTGKISLPNFLFLCHACNMDINMLYRLYVSKNVLNWFRQDRGYTDGTYLKHWDGIEDNEHLVAIVNEMSEEEFSAEELYAKLDFKYNILNG